MSGRERRGRGVKLHIAVNVKTKEIMSVRLTDDRVHDCEAAEPLIREASQGVHIVKLLADGAYDSRELFNVFQELGIEPVIRVRKDSSRWRVAAQPGGGWC